MYQRCTRRTFTAGERLIRQGDPGDALLILVEGRATATVQDSGGIRRPVGEFGAHDVIGEMAIVTDQPRTADVVADSAGSALELTSADFRELAGHHPELGLVLTHIVAERLGEGSADGLGGKVVAGYRIERCVGRGGMGIVYRALALESQRPVALKMMNHRLIYERGAMARFQREADILLGLEHQNITRVYERFSAFKTSFIAMEFCDGCDLSVLIRNGYEPDEEELRKLIGQLASGLAYLHSKGVVHRDLKPQNVLVDRTGLLKVGDFGLARSVVVPAQDAITMPGAILGTPYYMAPEQLEGAEASPQSDVYSLGCVLMQLITGVLPFTGATPFEIAKKKRSMSLPRRRRLGRRVSRKIYGLMKQCLEPEPDRRKVDLDALSRWSGPLAVPPDHIPVSADASSR